MHHQEYIQHLVLALEATPAQEEWEQEVVEGEGAAQIPTLQEGLIKEKLKLPLVVDPLVVALGQVSLQ